jgi:general secretion pathway protein G
MVKLVPHIPTQETLVSVEKSPCGADYRTITQHASGMTLIEVIIAVAILGILSAVSFGYYNDYQERIAFDEAEKDILAISLAVDHYQIALGQLPPDLDAVAMGNMLDPWGNPYEYLNMTGVKGKGKFRKNKNLVPINSDYDLYSKGPDGKSVAPLTAKASRDDIVRANNGRFIGVASSY